MQIGVLINLNDTIADQIVQVREAGFTSCQITNWNMDLYTQETAKRVRQLLAENGVTVSTFWAGWSGPKKWNFTEGPSTLGFLNPEHRSQRIEDMKRGSDFAEWLGVKQVATHAGFLPENPNDPEWPGMLAALREIAEYMKAKGQFFLFETGQETPITLLRAMEDIGTGNLGVNLDPANLILYGKANAVDSLKILGPYVMDVHAKDGDYPTCGRELGLERALGEGCVDFPALIAGLKACGYDGAITIEREISGEQQKKDILMAKEMLEKLI